VIISILVSVLRLFSSLPTLYVLKLNNFALKIYILIISILMIRRHLQCSLTTFKIVSGL
jgi:hypothetical protein